MANTKSTTAVLSPEPVEWQIGDKTYEQMPLRIDKLSDVLQEIIDTVLASGRANLLGDLLNSKNVDMAAMAPMLLQILITIPKKLPKIVALCLDLPKKETVIRDGLKARQAIQIIRAFIVQNEIAELLEDFFGLMGDLGINQEPEKTPKEQIQEKLEALKETKEDTETTETNTTE